MGVSTAIQFARWVRCSDLFHGIPFSRLQSTPTTANRANYVSASAKPGASIENQKRLSSSGVWCASIALQPVLQEG
jgi:hypothetical protein